MHSRPTRYVDFQEFYDANEPDDAGQLAALYRSLTDISDEEFYKTEDIHGKPKARYLVTASSGDTLVLTAKAYPAFVKFIEAQNSDPELGIEEVAALEYSLNNPHS